jgi:allantoinase
LRVVRPHGNAVHAADIAIVGGKVAQVAPGLAAERAKTVHDGQGRLAFPGVVDAHMHSGIYSPLDEDAVSESKAAAMGGVTSSLNYFRTGQYYLNKGGPYKKFFPEVLKISKDRFHVDYGYHLAPMDRTHIEEMPMLIEKHGVASFKIFMFYGSHGSARRQRQPARLPDDRQGRALRRRPLRIHHARAAGRPRSDGGTRRASCRSACTARPQRS